MTTSSDTDPFDDEFWRDPGLDLDAIGLADHFAAHARGRDVPPEEQRQALGAWLDGLIDELEHDDVENPPR